MPLTVDWRNDTAVRINEKPLEQHLNSVLQRLGSTGTVSVEINLVGDAAIRKLNKTQMQIDQITDVLSFPNPEFSLDQVRPLGAVVVSVETAEKQAKLAGVSVLTELKMLASHGLLHLFGYHHR